MGRIDEALRRSGNATAFSPPPAGGAAADDFFGSPWTFRERSTPAALPSVSDDRGNVTNAGTTAAAARALPGAELHRIRGFSDVWMERLVIAPGADPLHVEQFRQLAAALLHAHTQQNIRVVMVTSANAGEGKSLTAVNLALTLSDSYRQRVLLIDADLRRPSLHEVACVPNTSGLGDTLTSPVEQKLPVYQLSDTLMLVPAGKPDPDPMRALTSSRMHEILKEAATRFDWILIDAPPIGPIVDSSLLAPNIDAAIMVVRAGRTPYADVKRAVDSLGRDRIIGIVLNGADDIERVAYRGHYDASARDTVAGEGT